VAAEIRHLIRDMSEANPLWGAPRIHGELLKLGIEVAQSTVAKISSPPAEAIVPNLANLLDQSHGTDGLHRFFPGLPTRPSDFCLCSWCCRMRGAAYRTFR
jgi:hypothetical protein